jgi:hypothetical protein
VSYAEFLEIWKKVSDAILRLKEILIDQLGIDAISADMVANELKPEDKSSARLAEDGVGELLRLLQTKDSTALSFLDGEVREAMKEAFVGAVLVKNMKLSNPIAVTLASTVPLDAAVVLQYVNMPAKVPQLLVHWIEAANSMAVEQVQAAVQSVTWVVVQKKAKAIVKQIPKDMSAKFKQAVTSFKVEKDHLLSLVAGDEESFVKAALAHAAWRIPHVEVLLAQGP